MSRGGARAWVLTEPASRPVEIWGLTTAERLTRALVACGLSPADIAIGSSPSAAPDERSVVMLHASYVFDDRLVQALVGSTNTALVVEDGEARVRRCVAAHVDHRCLSAAQRALVGHDVGERELREAGIVSMLPHELVQGYSAKLRSQTPPFLLPANAGSVAAIERRLFDASYKGVTDLVTKWVWPAPARWVTSWLARRGVKPNTVTAWSWVLAAATGLLFAKGWFAWGLLLGWVMTFLDTVDGKLARVTLTSTKGGDVFDHSLDLLHPPLWYLAWGMGVGPDGLWRDPAVTVTVWGYLVGRLIEGLFLLVWKTEIHNWRPIDSWFRTVTARRNPNLILLTLGVFAGRPDLGMVLVAAWTVVSVGFHTVRLAQACLERVRGHDVEPWMSAAPPRSP